MSAKKIFYNFLTITLVLGIGHVQVIEYYKAQKKAEVEVQAELKSELDCLESETRLMKEKGRLVEKIESILAQFENQLNHDPAEIARLIVIKSQEYNMDPLLILGLIKVESDFYRYAVSSKGARGLMQILPPTGHAVAQEIDLSYYHDRSLDDGRINIILGIHYLAKLINKFGNLELALEAYNRGPGAIRKAIGKGRKIKLRFANRVLRNYKQFANEYISM